MLEELVSVFQHYQQVMSDCIVHAKVWYLNQALDLIPNGNSGRSQLLVLDLYLLVCQDLALESEGENWLSGIAKGVVKLGQITLLERMVQR